MKWCQVASTSPSVELRLYCLRKPYYCWYRFRVHGTRRMAHACERFNKKATSHTYLTILVGIHLWTKLARHYPPTALWHQMILKRSARHEFITFHVCTMDIFVRTVFHVLLQENIHGILFILNSVGWSGSGWVRWPGIWWVSGSVELIEIVCKLQMAQSLKT